MINQILSKQLIINLHQPNMQIGGFLNFKQLMENISNLFQTSTYHQSQNFIRKILTIAPHNIVTANTLNSDQGISESSIHQQNSKPKQIKIKKKLISKEKLKAKTLKKISTQNKNLYIKYTQKFWQKGNSLKIWKQNDSLASDEQEAVQFKYLQYKPNQRVKRSSQKSKQNYQKTENLAINNCRNELIDKKFEQKKKNFEINFKNFTLDELTCPICIEILIEPVSTLCGHSFCFQCIDQSMLFGVNCPVCRLQIKGTQIFSCPNLKYLIKLKQNYYETWNNYSIRAQNNAEWRKNRFIDPYTIKQYDLLDVRDTEQIWCKAKIEKIYYINKNPSSLLIHYLKWSKIYDEIIQIKSIRLAPYDYFSSRTDLPHYNLAAEDENVTGAVITGSNQSYQGRSNNSEFLIDNFLTNTNFFQEYPLPLRTVMNSQLLRRNQVNNIFRRLIRNNEESVNEAVRREPHSQSQEESEQSRPIRFSQNEFGRNRVEQQQAQQPDQSQSISSFLFRDSQQNQVNVILARQSSMVSDSNLSLLQLAQYQSLSEQNESQRQNSESIGQELLFNLNVPQFYINNNDSMQSLPDSQMPQVDQGVEFNSNQQ